MCTFVCMDIMWCSQTVLTVFTVWEGAFICLFVASWHQSLSALLLYLCCDELRSSDRWNLLFRVQVAGTVSGLTGVLNKFVTVRTFYQSDKPAGRSLRISPNVCVCVCVCACVRICGSRFASSHISSPLCWSQLLHAAQIDRPVCRKV